MSTTLIIIILSVALVLSILANCALLWYGWRSLKQIKYYDEELTETIGVISTFTNHLRSVYQLETFYGDETLRHLLEHAQAITGVFDQYDLYTEANAQEEISNDNTTEP